MLTVELDKATGVSIYRQIGDSICKAIADGALAPGDRLPTEEDMARSCSLNRLTVNRAYQELKTRGIVVRRPGVGTYVATDAAERLTREVGQRIRNLAFVMGETSLSVIPREWQFISLDIVEGIRDVLGEGGLTVKHPLMFTREHMGDLDSYDAIVVTRSPRVDIDLVLEARQRRLPIVTAWHDILLPSVPAITYSRSYAVNIACRHLAECGYRKVAFLGDRKAVLKNCPAKFPSFVQGVCDHGLELASCIVPSVDTTPGQAYAAMQGIIRGGMLPDALFVDTDLKAMEVVSALRDHGIRVPEDIGIVSYDDIADAARFTPPLTTVHIPRREGGRRAANLVANWPADGSVPENIELKPELIVRRSTRVSCVAETAAR